MTNSADEALLNHIAFLEDAVRRLDLHHEGVRSSLANAQVALDSAKRAVTVLSTQDATLRSHRRSLENDLDAQRLALERSRCDSKAVRAQKILAEFPSELLRAIFLRAFESANDVWRDNRELYFPYNPDDRRVPFALAAVNRQWRNVALDTPVIWSFVGVPFVEDSSQGEHDHATLNLVETLLRRSRNRHLDIFLDWSSGEWDALPSTCAKVLYALGRHAYRWRRASLGYPWYTKEDAIQVLRLPMPQLEHLAVSFCSVLPTYLVGYLPSCPRLRHFFNFGLPAVPARSLSQLISLDMTVLAFLPDVVWGTLKLLPLLEQLVIGFCCAESWELYDSDPLDRLSLHHLRELRFSGPLCAPFSSWIAALDVPRLRELDIDRSGLLPSLIPALENFAPTTTTLIIRDLNEEWNPLLHDHIDAIQRLHEIKHIVFRVPQFVSHELASTFTSREAAGLPHLQSVSFENPRLDGQSALRLCSLMHALHSNPNGNVTLSLSADPNAATVPEWLLQQYSALATANSSI